MTTRGNPTTSWCPRRTPITTTTAYVAYQAATQGRGADPQEVCKRADVCASAGARTPAAPAPAKTVHVVLMTPGASRARFGRTGRPELPNGDQAHGDDDPGTQTTTVAAVAPQLACMAQGAAIARAGAPMLAIAKTVADWCEQYCDLAARVGFEPEII